MSKMKNHESMIAKIDLLIKDGMVYDGTGAEPFKADIGISGNRIALIGKETKLAGNQRSRAEKIIDAQGLAVSPGFIDTHAHSDFTLLADPRAEGKLFQGVTTEINGNCGLSAAPLLREAYEHREKDLKELGIKERWSTLKEYFGILSKRNISINFATLAGHGNIRASVIGFKDKSPTKSELKKMQDLLKRTVNDGAKGLSTGLIYPPGVYSKTDELIELCRALNSAKHSSSHSKFIYTSHMRSEGNKLIEAIEEVIKIGRASGIRVHISHIKTSGEENWHKIDKAIALIENAKKNSIKITCDRYPYIAANTDLDAVLPAWTYEGGANEELKRLKSLRIREKIKNEMLQKTLDKDYWERVRVSSLISEKNKWMEGKTLYFISKKINKKPVDALFDILIQEKLRVGAIFFSMNEDNMRRFLSLSYTMIGSDASARSFSGPTCKGKPHPRGFGSFPRFLGKYVRDEKLMTLSKAIHKITMLPAKTFSLEGRGVIKKGAFADIVIFDPKRIIDKSTYHRPFLKPEGIIHVIVNGVLTISDSKFTSKTAGMILK